MTAITYTNGKDPKLHITSGFDATEVLELPGDLTIRANAFAVKTPLMDYICGYTEFQTPSVNRAEAVIDKNNPVDLWDF